MPKWTNPLNMFQFGSLGSRQNFSPKKNFTPCHPYHDLERLWHIIVVLGRFLFSVVGIKMYQSGSLWFKKLKFAISCKLQVTTQKVKHVPGSFSGGGWSVQGYSPACRTKHYEALRCTTMTSLMPGFPWYIIIASVFRIFEWPIISSLLRNSSTVVLSWQGTY